MSRSRVTACTQPTRERLRRQEQTLSRECFRPAPRLASTTPSLRCPSRLRERIRNRRAVRLFHLFEIASCPLFRAAACRSPFGTDALRPTAKKSERTPVSPDDPTWQTDARWG